MTTALDQELEVLSFDIGGDTKSHVSSLQQHPRVMEIVTDVSSTPASPLRGGGEQSEPNNQAALIVPDARAARAGNSTAPDPPSSPAPSAPEQETAPSAPDPPLRFRRRRRVPRRRRQDNRKILLPRFLNSVFMHGFILCFKYSWTSP